MRTVLDALYRGSGWLAAGFLAAIAGVVLLQVGLNVTDVVADWLFGAPIGLVIPSYAEFAGFFLAASSFLALASTLRHGAHIRVAIVLQRLPQRLRRIAEVWCAGAGSALVGYFAWYMIALAMESWRYGDVSPGMVAVPLWLPQSAMAVGLVALTIALLDTLVAATLHGDVREHAQDLETDR